MTLNSRRKQHKIYLATQHQKIKPLQYGNYALLSKISGWLTERHLTQLRLLLSKRLKIKNSFYFRVTAKRPITRKGLNARQGKGKGAISHYVVPIVAGIPFLVFNVSLAKINFLTQQLASIRKKLPFPTILVKRSQTNEIKISPRQLPK